MCKIFEELYPWLSYDVSVGPSTRAFRLSGWRWGGRTASGDGSFRTIFLGRKSCGSVAFGNPLFSGRKSYCEEQLDKDERAEKSTREEATKFEKFRRRKPGEKPRKEKKRKFQQRTLLS